MKLSIITPTRNRLKYLKENVASVRASVTAGTDLQVEHVILDCGSNDGTREWLQGSDADGLIVILKDGPIPPGQARNEAIARSSGDLIMPLDDDDVLLQRSAFHFASALTAETSQWAIADFLKIDSEGRYLPGEDYYAWSFPTADDMLTAIFSGQHYIQGNVCFCRQLFDQVGGYSELKTAEDLELYTRFVLAVGLPCCVPTVSHLHRIHDRNVSRDIGKEKYNEDMQMNYEMNRSSLTKRGIELRPIP